MSTWKATIKKVTAGKADRGAVAEPVVITVYERTQTLPQLEEIALEILADDEFGVDPYNRSGNRC